jgi:hypothetical protein
VRLLPVDELGANLSRHCSPEKVGFSYLKPIVSIHAASQCGDTAPAWTGIAEAGATFPDSSPGTWAICLALSRLIQQALGSPE